jgi:hypothetical protein
VVVEGLVVLLFGGVAGCNVVGGWELLHAAG